MKLNNLFKPLLVVVILPLIATSVFAAGFTDQANNYLNKICNQKKVDNTGAVLCFFRDRLGLLEQRQNSQQSSINNLQTTVASTSADITLLKNNQPTGKTILDLKQVRGAFWENTHTVNNVATPDHVTVNCPKACILWVNYDVDTRNPSGSIAQSSWPQHLYHIYVDNIDQAVFNQASMVVANAAVPLAVNGVFPASAGQHTIAIYARTTGGTLQSFESHLQVMAIEQ